MKPHELTAYRKAFYEPCEFWTSEDGTLLSLAILPGPGAIGKLKSHWVFQKERFNPRRARRKFALREWCGGEYFDGNSGRRKGKLWFVVEEETEFPVIEYELKIPR